MKRIAWFISGWMLILNVAQAATLASDADRRLFEAVELGNLSEVTNALQQGANVNSLESNTSIRLTPLQVAASHEMLDVVTALLKAGANPNLSSNGEPPLFFAIGHDSRIAKVLLESGANPNIKTAINYTPLQRAASCQGGHVDTNCEETIKLLIKAGAKIDERGFGGATPISEAVFWGNHKIIEILASSGADLNLKNNSEQTPLMVAFYWYALEQDAKLKNISYSRDSALPTIELLLKLGADANGRDDSPFEEYADSITVPYTNGNTALTLSVRQGWYRVAELLLISGADPTITRNDGLTPIELSEIYDHPEITKLIRKYMKNNSVDTSLKPDTYPRRQLAPR